MYYVLCDDKLLDCFDDEGAAFCFLSRLQILYEDDGVTLEIYCEEKLIHSEIT